MPIEETEFKNKPILVITDTDNPRIRISFGVTKANLIINNIKDIRAFALKNLKSIEPDKENNPLGTQEGESI